MTIKTIRHYADHWSAYDDNTYDGPGSVLGTGRTEDEAKADLLEQLQEREEEEREEHQEEAEREEEERQEREKRRQGLTRDEYTIDLDAHFDLAMAGLPCEDSDCEEFEEKYNDAAAEIAEERGITIYILNVRGCGYESDRSQEADKDEEAVELWQAIHDRI